MEDRRSAFVVKNIAQSAAGIVTALGINKFCEILPAIIFLDKFQKVSPNICTPISLYTFYQHELHKTL